MYETSTDLRRLLVSEALERLAEASAPRPRPIRRRLGRVLVSAGTRIGGDETRPLAQLPQVSSGRAA
jgi:hypothetical protein